MMINCLIQKLHSADVSAIRVREHSATTSRILVACERESVEFRVEQHLDQIFVDFARKLGVGVDAYEKLYLSVSGWRKKKPSTYMTKVYAVEAKPGEAVTSTPTTARSRCRGDTRPMCAPSSTRYSKRSSCSTPSSTRPNINTCSSSSSSSTTTGHWQYFLIRTTPFHICALLDHFELVKYLVKRGADVHLTNESDWSCLEICARQNHAAFAAFLIVRQSQQE